jgi:hypothetical protein
MTDTTKDGEDTRQKATEDTAQSACNDRLCGGIDTKYCIIIVHTNRAFEAERLKGESIVFVDFWSNNQDEWSLIQCQSEQSRDKLLKIMDNQQERFQQYALGYKHGRNNEKFGGNI